MLRRSRCIQIFLQAHQTRHTRSQLAHNGAKAWRPAAPPQPRTSGRRRPALYAIYISPLASGCCFSTSQTVEERRRKEKMGHGLTPRRKRLRPCSRSGEHARNRSSASSMVCTNHCCLVYFLYWCTDVLLLKRYQNTTPVGALTIVFSRCNILVHTRHRHHYWILLIVACTAVFATFFSGRAAVCALCTYYRTCTAAMMCCSYTKNGIKNRGFAKKGHT